MPSTVDLWGTGPEAGDWSPASAVGRHFASGLVSSLVISVVAKLAFSCTRSSCPGDSRLQGVEIGARGVC